MRPMVVLFSEAIRTAKRGRKTGVTLGFDTQSSRTDAIPSQLVENVGINGCFSVKTWRSNDGSSLSCAMF
jgi:S-DNA-T family DNA segregation ATPase FtsK/SpoIIIE